jgi:hypothetical protein
MEGEAIGHNFEMGLSQPNLVQWFQRRRFKCDHLSKYA